MRHIDEYLLNKIFTIPYIDKMIDENSIPDSFLKFVRKYVKCENITYGKALSEIYHYMDFSYRNEYFYKNTMLNKLLIEKHDVYNTAVLTELPIEESKADFIMINGRGILYEIKTDLDNLIRLENQIRDYYKVFSYVYVVVGKKQLQKVSDFLPNQKVGIFELNEERKLIKRRKAYCNRNDLSHETMFKLLRKQEFESILLKYYGKLPEVNSFQYYRECLEWLRKLNVVTLQKEVMFCLKMRTLLKIEKKFDEKIPYELRFYAYFSKKYKKDYSELDTFLEKVMEV